MYEVVCTICVLRTSILILVFVISFCILINYREHLQLVEDIRPEAPVLVKNILYSRPAQ